MADEKQPSKAAIFFAKHGEKVGLAVVCAALLIYLLLVTVMGGQDIDRANTKASVDSLEQAAKNGNKEAFGVPKVEPYLAQAVNPYTKVEKTTQGGTPWAMSVPTKFVLTKEVAKEVKPPTVNVMPSVTLSVGDVTIDGVPLSWSLGAVAGENTKALEVDQYIVEKMTTKGWEKLTQIDRKLDKSKKLLPPETAFKDDQIAPKTVYHYRVTAISLDRNAKGEILTSTVKARKESNEVQAKTLGIFEVTFSQLHLATQERKGWLYVTIKKFDSEHGTVALNHIHNEGETIGVWPEGEGGEPTGTHKTTLPGGKSAKIDYDTKYVIKEIKEVKEKLERIRCDPQFDRTGGKIECKHIAEKVDFTSMVVVWTDDDGATHTWYAKERKVQDLRCEDCGGPTRSDGGGTTDLKERREKTAGQLLAEADKAYDEAEKENDKKKWRSVYEKYVKLSKEYADTDLVKGKKATIDDRIKKASEKK